MQSKKVRRVTGPRKLTDGEAAEARRLRELVEKDKDEILADGRRILAEKRQREAAEKNMTTLGQTIRAARGPRAHPGRAGGPGPCGPGLPFLSRARPARAESLNRRASRS